MKNLHTRTLTLFGAALIAPVVAAACGSFGADPDDDGYGESSDGEGGESPSGDGDFGPGGSHSSIEPGNGGNEAAEDPTELPSIDTGAPVALPAFTAPAACGLSESPYLIGGNIETSGFLHVQHDLSSTGTLSSEAVTRLSGATSHAVFANGTAYVSHWEKPIIERWQVGDLDAIEKTGVLELASAGVSSTGSTRQLVQVFSATKAYYIDPENNFVRGFNPQTMGLDGVFIDLTEGFGPADDYMALGDVHRDGEHLIVSARFWDTDWNVESVVRAAFIDSRDDSVSFAEDTRCGDLAWHVTDTAGNLYLGSHYDNVAANHFGGTGTDSCILRINRGERSFDASYYVDMDALLDGTGSTLLQGPGDQAYIMKYAGGPLDEANWNEVRYGAEWELYSITLDDEDNSLKQIDLGGRKFNPSPTPFCADSTQSMIGFSGDAFETGRLFVIDTAGEATAALSYSGALGRAVSLD